jgi:uncharacterized membrane protein
MEIVFGLLILLAIPVLAIVAFVLALNARESIRRLQDRLARLEASQVTPQVAATSAGAAQPSSPTVEEARETGQGPVGTEPPTEPAAIPPDDVAAKPVVLTPAPPEPARPATLEERFGTQWVVWIGGLALALGAIFLVRYTIEQGLLGPGVRIFLAGLFAAVLIAAGEWTRRNEIAAGISAIPAQHIPSILTAAGTVAAYATVYAAYALYGFLSPGPAFILLGIVALATLAGALLHGPALAGLGLAGAFLAPALVATDEPNYWALYLYLIVVNAAAVALARLRLWRWLAITAVVLGALWALPGIANHGVAALGAHLFYIVASFTVAAALIVSGLLFGPEAESGAIDEVSSGALAAYILVATVMVARSHHDTAALAVFALLMVATVAITWRAESALWALPTAGLMTAVVMLQWAAPRYVTDLVMPPGVTRGAIPDLPTGVGPHLMLGGALAALFVIAGFAVQGRTSSARIALIWSGTAVATPVVILIALYWRIAELDRSVPFAGLALLMAALFGYATELLSRREPRPGIAGSAAVFATGAVASLALALTFALEKGWLTVALALMVPGIAWIAERRPLPALRQLAAVVILLVVARVAYAPSIAGRDLGTTPLFNWLLYGYGVPAAAFWTAGHLLRRRADDGPARLTDAAAILFTVLLALLEIRHYVTGGRMFKPVAALAEVGIQISIGIAIAIGLERLRLRTGGVVHNIGALVVAALTLAATVIGLGLMLNPFFNATDVGGLFFNVILLGYGIPAVLAAILAYTARETRPLPYRYVAAATTIALTLLYFSLEVRRFYQGSEILPWVPASDAEQYTYSLVWLVLGVALLAAGVVLRSQPARLASAVVVALTIGKVFLVDMAGLTGILRALSFIGLGVVLVGIGWLYQRLLFPPRGGAITSRSMEAGNG